MKTRRVFILCLILLIATGLVFFYQHRWVTAIYGNRVEFLGRTDSPYIRPEYFSVRVVESETEEVIPPDCPLLFTWKSQTYRVADITPEKVKQMGGEVSLQDYKSAGHHFGSIGGFDSQNRDFGVEFSFKDDRMIGFYARFHRATGCPFEIAFEGRPSVLFPLKQTELIAHFGQPKSIESHPGK